MGNEWYEVYIDLLGYETITISSFHSLENARLFLAKCENLGCVYVNGKLYSLNEGYTLAIDKWRNSENPQFVEYCS